VQRYLIPLSSASCLDLSAGVGDGEGLIARCGIGVACPQRGRGW